MSRLTRQPGDDEGEERPSSDLRCTWNAASPDRRCHMPGGIGTRAPRCAWHSFALADPRLTDEFEEFERWALQLHEANYCAVWTHFRVDTLWQAVRGVASLPYTPVACNRSGCPYRPTPAEPAFVRGRSGRALVGPHALAPQRDAPAAPQPMAAFLPGLEPRR